MSAGDALHEMRGRMVAKVRADISDPEPLAGGNREGELVRRLVEYGDLLEAELGVAVGDGLAELVRERVEHGVVRVHRGQTVLLQLVCHDRDEGLLPRRVVGPVTHDLKEEKTVSKIAAFKNETT